jgi:H+/Cl- antiporter ClcA
METNGVRTPEAMTAPGTGVVVTDSEPSVTSLVSGIIADAQHLIEQQLMMFRQEIRDDFRKAWQAAIPVVLGILMTLVGVVLVLLMFPLLLHWALPELPLWACFGIVGGVLAAVGGVLIFTGIKKFESFNPLSDKAMTAFKENLKWTKNPK